MFDQFPWKNLTASRTCLGGAGGMAGQTTIGHQFSRVGTFVYSLPDDQLSLARVPSTGLQQRQSGHPQTKGS